jgi:hypothetical protein
LRGLIAGASLDTAADHDLADAIVSRDLATS